jgi:hypothetical protein
VPKYSDQNQLCLQEEDWAITTGQGRCSAEKKPITSQEESVKHSTSKNRHQSRHYRHMVITSRRGCVTRTW